MPYTIPPDIEKQLNELKELVKKIKSELPRVEQQRIKNNHQHAALLLNIHRAIKYTDAYILLAWDGYGEPAACLLRSIFDANIQIRWFIKDYENAIKYFAAGQGGFIRSAEKIRSKGLLGKKKRENVDNREVKEALNSVLKVNKFRKWEDMAKDVGLDDLFASIYPVLSAMCHGNYMFLYERLSTEKIEFNYEPDEKNIRIFVFFAYDILKDCYLVCREWIVNGKEHPVPDYKSKFTGVNLKN